MPGGLWSPSASGASCLNVLLTNGLEGVEKYAKNGTFRLPWQPCTALAQSLSSHRASRVTAGWIDCGLPPLAGQGIVLVFDFADDFFDDVFQGDQSKRLSVGPADHCHRTPLPAKLT